MLKEFLRFELYYRRRRISTYAYALIVFLISFLIVVSPNLNISGADGSIKANAPFVITYLMLVLTFAYTMITSAISGVTVVRDFDHNMESILFSTQLNKSGYLLGRFLGAFMVLILVNIMMILGLMLGYSVGKSLPWDVSWKFREMLPMQLESYVIPFLVFTIPNLFISASLFFASGALGRKAIVIYTQGVILIVLYQISFSLLRDLDSQYFAALIDPFGVQTFLYVSKYWTSSEQNTFQVSLTGVLLYNRLIWLGIGLAVLIFTYFKFSFDVVKGKGKGKAQVVTTSLALPSIIHITDPYVHEPTLAQRLFQILSQGWLYFKMTIREVPFLAIIICGIITLIVKAFRIDQIYGTSSYPTTYSILSLLSSFDLYFLVLVIFYSGELIWKDRNVNFHLIQDSLPVPNFVNLASKFVALLIIYLLLLTVLIICGVLVQVAYNYYRFELQIYLGTLFTSTLSFLVLYTLFSFFVQVLVNNKFQGFVICIVFYILNAFINQMGLEHDLWKFASGSLGVYSDMNHYGHFVRPFSWLKIYWLSFTGILFLIAIVFYTRGSDTDFWIRWKSGVRRVQSIFMLLVLFLIFFISSGFYVYYNTSIINRFQTSKELQQISADYERELKKFEHLNQPKITSIKINADIYPYERNFTAVGHYILKNKSSKPIDELHIQNHWNERVTVDDLKFNKEAVLYKEYKNFKYTIYRFQDPLQPRDSFEIEFKISYRIEGFKENEDTDLVFNGTFISNEIFPTIGYSQKNEITSRSDRKRFNLPPRTRFPDSHDPGAHLTNIFGDDADQIQFELQIGTVPDQFALAPGTLQKDWTENGRRYFHYKMKKPMNNFYSILSARYSVKKEDWKGVELAVYYHPTHNYNIDRMMQSMKDALSYYSDNFGPYPYNQLRIVEFPRYAAFAQSFPNTIPFSEGAGFILKVSNPNKDLDVPYYVTAHEVAHQWWGHQITPAHAKGSFIISEGLSQYSALMIMDEHLHPDQVERYLKYEQDNYLKGRFSEKQKEPTLESSEDQNYIFYNKASLVFYALQDYIGKTKLNLALNRFYNEWSGRESYPTLLDLKKEIRMVTPDTLQYLIHDLFESITLFENETIRASYEQKPDKTFELSLKLKVRKMQADSTGYESVIPINDWIDIGVYTRDNLAKPKLVYLKKHKFTFEEQQLTIRLKERPYRAGIDPLHKLIDRHLIDNVINANEIIPIAKGM